MLFSKFSVCGKCLLPGALLLFSLFSCQKDRSAPVQFDPGLAAAQNYPISLAEAMVFFSKKQGSVMNSLDESQFIKMEPRWNDAFIGQALSGREILTVPLPDSMFKSANHGRTGAKLLFSKIGPDTINADLVVYVADSTYYAACNGDLDFQTFTGAYVFFDLAQHFRYAIYVDSGAVVGGTDTILVDHIMPVSDREVHCVQINVNYLVPTCEVVVALDCAWYMTNITLSIWSCDNFVNTGGGPPNPGNTSGGGGGSSGGGGGTPGDSLNINSYPIYWLAFTGGLPISFFEEHTNELPAGFDLATFIQLNEIVQICKFTNAEKELIQVMTDNPELVPAIHAFLSSHNINPPTEDNDPPLPHSNDKVVAVAVAKAYLTMLQQNNSAVVELISDIEGVPVGDPLMDMIVEQLAEALKAVLIDLLPGGTLVTSAPIIKQHFEQGNILEGLWECVVTALDEGGRVLPLVKAANLTIGIVNIADKMGDFYKVLKKAKNLGDDVVYRLYQVLKNKLDVVYTKVKWINNTQGARISDAGDPLDFWDELISIFGVNPDNIHCGNGNELVATFILGGNSFTMKFYPASTSPPNCPTISIQKGNGLPFKMRFC